MDYQRQLKQKLKREDPFYGRSDAERGKLMEPCAHDWTGPEVNIGRGSSISCAKCGMLAIENSLLREASKELIPSPEQ